MHMRNWGRSKNNSRLRCGEGYAAMEAVFLEEGSKQEEQRGRANLRGMNIQGSKQLTLPETENSIIPLLVY